MSEISRPGVKKHEVTCPLCGALNKITEEQFLKGYRCSVCGGKVGGIGSGSGGTIKPVVCPQCKSKHIRVQPDDSGNRFCCNDCGAVW